MRRTLITWSAPAGVLGAVLLAASGAWTPISAALGLPQARGGSFAEVAGIGVALVAFALVGVRLLLAGTLPPWGRAGLVVTFGGVVTALAAFALWWGAGWVGGIAAAVAGVLVFLAAALTTGLLPRGALSVLLLSVLAAGLSYATLDHPAVSVPGARAALAGNLAGFVWLAPHLWRAGAAPTSRAAPAPRWAALRGGR